jgi:DNA-binding CsgD family transcriptional regulator
MDNQRIKKTIFQEKLALKQHQFFHAFAKDYLKYLGNPNPGNKQLAEMQALLSHVWVRRTLCFDLRLTELEQQCLYLSAQGKGIKEIASFLKVSSRRVEQYRQAIFQKLECKNISEAITLGLRYGEIMLL